MTKAEFAAYLETRFEAIRQLRAAGQAEYAHADSAFDNFERLATECGFPGVGREQILWVYLKKHLDGILSHLRGKRSQREPVQGRIQDAIVYLFLLMGMEDQNAGHTVDAPGIDAALPPANGPAFTCDYCKDTGRTTFKGTDGTGAPFEFNQKCPWCLLTPAEEAATATVMAPIAADTEAMFAAERQGL